MNEFGLNFHKVCGRDVEKGLQKKNLRTNGPKARSHQSEPRSPAENATTAL